jgi:hypothetical protein
MHPAKFTCSLLASVAPVLSQTNQLKTADAVLERYKQASGGVEMTQKIDSETAHGEIVGTGLEGKLPSSVMPSSSNPFSKLSVRMATITITSSTTFRRAYSPVTGFNRTMRRRM